MIGIAVAIFYILRRNFRNNYSINIDTESAGKTIRMELAEEVTFLNKASILEFFYEAEENSRIIIDGTKCTSINYDVLEAIQEFKEFGAPEKNIELTLINISGI